MDRKVILLLTLWTFFIAFWTADATRFFQEKARHPRPAYIPEGVTINGAKEFAALARGYLSQTPSDYQKASYYFEKAHKLNPQDGEIARWLGSCYRCLNRPYDALSYYKKALDINKDDAYAIFLLGFLYAEDWKDARSARLCLFRLRELQGQETDDLIIKLDQAINRMIPRLSPPISLSRCATEEPAQPLPSKTAPYHLFSVVNLEN